MTAVDWAALAARVEYPTKLFINGRWVEAADGASLPVVSPVDGREINRVALGGAADIDAAVAAARASFEDGRWSGLAPAARKDIMVRWAQLCVEHADELAVLHTLEMGKPAREARNVDVRAVVNTIRWFGEAIDKVLDEIPNTAPNSLALIRKEAAGVVGAVVPWNFPLTMAAWKLAPALAVGCSTVLKPAENSPLSALLLARLAAEAGIPDGVLNVVNGLGAVAGQALGRHMDVDIITFTGSTGVGRMFMEYAAQSNCKRVWPELGGKSANLIFADADLEKAANTAAWSIFYNQGEMCTAGARLVVHRSVYDEVMDRVLAYAAKTQPANPLDADAPMGALVSAKHLDRVHSMVQEASAEVGSPVIGGAPVRQESGGYYYPPTIFSGVDPAAGIAQEEVFGPVLSVIPFDTDDEAIKIANHSQYGLGSAIWTRDLNRAHLLSRRIQAGMVWVNCYEEGDMTMPFGGVKMSGFGRDKSLHALDKFTDIKTTWIDLS